ncbi:hypothetical protein CHUAL_012596 [Chamberlinius hualienensis]
MNDASFERCCLALKSAKTDTEKFAALLLSTRLIQSPECTDDHRKLLFSSIGFNFVHRLLTTSSDDVPEDCPPHIFRNLALNIYASFCTQPEFVYENSTHMVDKVPVFLKLLSALNAHTSEEEIGVKNDALRCLLTLASNPKTCVCLVERENIVKICEIYAKEDLGDDFRDEVFSVINVCISQLGSACWQQNPEAFNILMNSLSSRMLKSKTQHKFTLCNVITAVFASFPIELRNSCSSCKWYLDFHEELLGILCFKLGHAQREPLLKLCSAITEKLGVSWALNNINNNINYADSSSLERSQRLFFLLVQLSCIEVRMILEEFQCVEEVIQKSELASACFVILEHAMKFLIEDDGQTVRSAAQIQLYGSITDAMKAVLGFFNVIGGKLDPAETENFSDLESHFVQAAVRVLGAWLAEETMALREEVYQILPFLLRLCKNRLESKWCDIKCLEFVLPGMCHLVVEDLPRSIMMREMVPSCLVNLMGRIWSELEVKDDDDMEIELKSENESEHNLVTASNILLQLVVLEGERVQQDLAFMGALRFVFTALPLIDKRVSYLLLRGNFSVLGLLLLRHHSKQVSGTHEVTIYRYLSASIRFLWDAFNVDDSSDGTSLVVNRAYRDVWDQVREMWYLGMQALSELLPNMPWVCQFIVESGWAEEIVNMINKAKKTGLEGSVKAAYEDFLCCLVKTFNGAAENLQNSGAVGMCKLHKMKELAKLLKSVAKK